MGFADSMKKSVDKITQQINDKVLETATELFSEIVRETPVRTGLLINNWFSGVGAYSTAKTNVHDTTGAGSLLNIESLLQSDAFKGQDGWVSLSNNLDYAYRAEHLGWPTPQWSGRVGPYKMVENSMIKYRGLLLK